MKRIALILTIFPLTYVFASECKTNEVLIASCDLPGKTPRSAIFCANENFNSVQYIFARDRKPELVVNFNQKNKLKRWLDLWTYSTYLGFSKGAYSYVLVIPEERPDAVALLEVSKDGRKKSRLRCGANSFGEKNIKSLSIEDVPDSIIINNGFQFP